LCMGAPIGAVSACSSSSVGCTRVAKAADCSGCARVGRRSGRARRGR
jgi:hypothetical protein